MNDKRNITLGDRFREVEKGTKIIIYSEERERSRENDEQSVRPFTVVTG